MGVMISIPPKEKTSEMIWGLVIACPDQEYIDRWREGNESSNYPGKSC